MVVIENTLPKILTEIMEASGDFQMAGPSQPVGQTLHRAAVAVRHRVAQAMHRIARTMEPTEIQQGEEDGMEMRPMRILAGRSVQVDQWRRSICQCRRGGTLGQNVC